MHRAAVNKAPLRPRVIFSGIQPTGVPHLGNYVGALRQWVQMQDQEASDTKLMFSVVDLHALTTPQAPEKLRQDRRESLAALLAIGIDPDRSTLFFQSAVPAHSELIGSKSLIYRQHHIWGIDVLVHRATHVPVGHDQQQHLEFARECVTSFNHAYGPHLVHPRTITLIPSNNKTPSRSLLPAASNHRIMSLTDPTSKMSKSHKSERSRILITDTPDQIHAKIASALTDSTPGITYDSTGRPGVSNLLDIYSSFDPRHRAPQQLAEEYSTAQPRQLKSMVADAVVEGLRGVRQKYLHLIDSDKGCLEEVAADGAHQARHSAKETMELVRNAVGL
ncbi:hypothetical protein XA68_18267 [Ophiocordyceps unilateralis]|uniref:tryptophan--tRNA ligase n=1 Tax=Ophiocordyceps unilateralis TaxID=268505 RepID=A0A2A9P2R3_OPHUN|nr:hypothetical protein XA68_18267 [Ophiocordyceps unilateralis]